MKIKLTLLLLFCFVTSFANTQSLSDSVKNLNNDVAHLQRQVDFNNNNFSTANSSISNQLMITSITIAFGAILVSLGGVAVGIYANKKFVQIQNLQDSTVELLAENKELTKLTSLLKEQLELFSKNTIPNSETLYDRIHFEEFGKILKFLMNSPTSYKDFEWKLKTLFSITIRDNQLFLDVAKQLSDRDRSDFLNFIIDRLGVSIIVTNKDFINLFSDVENLLNEQQAFDLISLIFQKKIDGEPVSDDIKTLIKKHIVPFAKQKDFEENRIYTKLNLITPDISEFMQPHLTKNHLKGLYIEFLAKDIKKYYSDDFPTFYADFKEFLATEKKDIYDPNVFVKESNWAEEFFNEYNYQNAAFLKYKKDE